VGERTRGDDGRSFIHAKPHAAAASLLQDGEGADQCVAEALQMRPIVGRAAMFFAKVMSECVTTAAVGV
jgi:hypothetical protein